MLPSLRPGQIVVARQKFLKLKTGDVVIVRHNGLEKIKRIASVDGQQVTVLGDNSSHSTDSRHFGPLNKQDIVGKVLSFHG